MKKAFKLAVGPFVMGISVIAAGLYGTADTNLTDAVNSVQSYFSANIGAVIGLVVGIALLVWMLRLAFHSVGVRKPRSVD